MDRPALATTDDLDERLGRELEGTDALQAAARLADASEIVRAYAGVSWLNEDQTALVAEVPGQIAGVVASMVERATRNPGGVTQEQAGPFSHSFGPEASARLYMTKNERMVIRAAAGRSSLGYVRLEGEGVPGCHIGQGFAGEYAYDQFGGDLIPWADEADL